MPNMTTDQYNAITKPGKVVKRARDLNKTEAAYCVLLNQLARDGQIRRYWTQAIHLQLAHDCRYTPDFAVERNDGRIVFVEIKGFLREDADIKFKAAVKEYPCFEFVMLQRKGGWWDEVKRTEGAELVVAPATDAKGKL